MRYEGMKKAIIQYLKLQVMYQMGDAIAQPVERAIPAHKVVGSVSTPRARSLLVGSVSV